MIALLFSSYSYSQYVQLSPTAEVSIITVGPGSELYDKFGHSAFRINDQANGFDIAYNYGTYDFNTPNFYLKFAQGKLLYEISDSSFAHFYQNYVYQNRWVKEQVLNLNAQQRQDVFNYLQNNVKPENKKYKYDFFYDNCATKIRDVLVEVIGDELEYTESYINQTSTFRELIRDNLNENSWGSLGIDLGLGAVIDVNATPWQHQFLPDYIFLAAKNAKIETINGTEDFVAETYSLFENRPINPDNNFFKSPLFVFGILGIIIVFISINDFRKNKRSRYLDTTIFIITGFIGCFILFLWFGTDHNATAANYNLLWAFPLSLGLAFATTKRFPKPWLYRYVIFLILLMVLLFIHWITGVQKFSIGFLPLFIALTIRYVFLAFTLPKKTEEVLVD